MKKHRPINLGSANNSVWVMAAGGCLLVLLIAAVAVATVFACAWLFIRGLS